MDNNDKLINSRCICKKGLPWVKKSAVIMLDPCEHLIHLHCFNNSKECPYCGSQIDRIIKKDDYKKDKRLYQKCIDIMAMSCAYKRPKFDLGNFVLGLPNMIGLISQIPFTKGFNDAKQMCGDLLSSHNVKIKVKGFNKIKDEKKVFIVNHASHFDYLILFYILNSGFLTSAFVNDNFLSKQIKNIIPMLIVERQKSMNTVEKMKEYIGEHGSICMFPEGIITNPNALIRFRSGAFHTGYPVYPIVLKYHNGAVNSSISSFMFQLVARQDLKVTMYILDPVHPPFDDQKIELVREKMAKKGKMLLSRVSNRDIIDTNKANE